MDVTRAIQIAVARADLIVCRAGAALPAVAMAACACGFIIMIIRRCTK